MIDLDAIKAKLAEYDDALPRCPLKIALRRTVTDPYGDYDMTTYSPCCRPEGHEGECRNSRLILGWPGFVTVSALVAEIERLREVNDDYLLEMGRQHALLRDQKREENEERAAVVAWLREDAEILLQRYDRSSAHVEDLADNIEQGVHREDKSRG